MPSNTPRTLEEALEALAARDRDLAARDRDLAARDRDLAAVRAARIAEREAAQAVVEREIQAIQRETQAIQRRTQAAQRRTQIAEQGRLKAIRDAAAARTALQEFRNERARLEQAQPLHAYLSQIHDASFLLARLMPVAASATPARVASTQTTTSGRTDITNKYYPLKLRVWTDFPQLHRDAFARIQASVQDQALFPSPSAVRQLKVAVMDELPREFLQSGAFLSETKTSDFVDRFVQKPVQRVMNAYLTANHMEKKIFFDNCTAGFRHASNATVESGEDEARPSPPRKPQPNCVVLGTNTDATAMQVSEAQNEGEAANEGEDAVRHVYRVTLGEHKAAHKLRADTVAGILRSPPAEDFMITLARRRSKLPLSTSAASGSDTSDTPGAEGQIFFVDALSQAFHYMILSDMEFGYIASGETLTFLRIPRDDRTALLFYSSVFPNYANGSKNRKIEQAALPTAQLSSLCLMAIESDPDRERRASRISSDLALLAPFPQLPASVPLAPEPPHPFDPSSFRPLLPYCTQACLRSLACDEELDYNCPNVLLHVRAADAAYAADASQPPRRHALIKQDVAELVQSQLLRNPDLDCECFHDRGLRGAIGSLFKITLTGYGYTFVAKGVAAHNAHKLRREMRVYDMLASQQGTLIPVCLGIAALRLPYPLGNFQVVTHMLLMSYAGAPLHTRKVQKRARARGIDLDEEAARTVRELAALGFVDEDEESTINFAWCDEIGRVMKIDFDQAKVYDTPAEGVDSPMTMSGTEDAMLLSPDRKKRVAGWDLEGMEGPRKRSRQHLNEKVEGLLLV